MSLYIGVRNLRIRLGTCLVKLSFEIEANFLAAAKSDCLKDTVDYEALSKHLEAKLKDFSCQQKPEIEARLAAALTSFSTLISGNYLETKILCDAGCDSFNIKL